MKKNNTIYTKKSDLDQFYTSEETAKYCYNEVLKRYNEDDFSLFFKNKR